MRMFYLHTSIANTPLRSPIPKTRIQEMKRRHYLRNLSFDFSP